MPRNGLCFEKIAKAAEELLLSGQNPTITRIRSALGDTGSITTISKYGGFFLDWRALHPNPLCLKSRLYVICRMI